MAAPPESDLPPSGLDGNSLLRAFVEFGHFLRDRGYSTVQTQPGDLVRAAAVVGLSAPTDFRNSARAIFAGSPSQFVGFDEAFEEFWLGRRTVEPGMPLGGITPHPAREYVDDDMLLLDTGARGGSVKEVDIDPSDDGTVRVAAYSPVESLRHMDFGYATSEELTQIRRLIAALRWDIAKKRARRLRPASRPGLLDMRRIVRSTLRQGGEPARLFWRRPKIKPRPMVLLCDISGSMELYSRILITFAHALQRGLRDVESFVFGTRLTRVTWVLRDNQVDEALRRVSKSVVDWSSGTRIGQSLHQFNRTWARRKLSRGAVVLIASDGWDRGDVGLLADEMRYLQRSAFRLIWLNPLLGQPEYQPLTLGMQAALPYVDDFLPVHNLASLEQLGSLLAGLSGGRPSRVSGAAIPFPAA
ncbi:MAG: VWA domain-containing protein [Chloroflexi bacterium]|nr:VWA domain-containing protein [Chloroflexota bacterium]MCY3936827.1 VWA domain-containing protein [Chloroflexota bacterium]